MRLVKAKKLDSRTPCKGPESSMLQKEAAADSPRMNEGKGKVPEADAPNVEYQEGGGCLGRLKTDGAVRRHPLGTVDGPKEPAGTSITLSTNILQ